MKRFYPNLKIYIMQPIKLEFFDTYKVYLGYKKTIVYNEYKQYKKYEKIKTK